MFIRHDDLDFIDFGYCLECALGHCVEGLLDGLAVVRGEAAERTRSAPGGSVNAWGIAKTSGRRTDPPADRERWITRLSNTFLCRSNRNGHRAQPPSADNRDTFLGTQI